MADVLLTKQALIMGAVELNPLGELASNPALRGIVALIAVSYLSNWTIWMASILTFGVCVWNLGVIMRLDILGG